jgi:hypothetical protein
MWIVAAGAGLVAVALLAVLVLAADRADGEPAPPACAVPDLETPRRQINAYAQSADGFPVRTEVANGRPSAVTVELAPIEIPPTGDESPTLPAGPCQHISRFALQDVPPGTGGVASPFRFMEIDWNTEGKPRGPNGSFLAPHFDVHLYLPGRERIRSLDCVPQPPTDRVCDPIASDYERMREFLDLPAPGLVPPSYRADPGSAIPMMGLHHLDGAFDYTVDSVNHTPTIIYGSYAGEVVFLEASVTIPTLRDVRAAPRHELTWEIRQPARFAAPTDWPTELVLRYLPDAERFEVSFAGLRRYAAGPVG